MSDLIDLHATASVRARRRIAPMIFETPLLPSRALGEKHGCDLHFKAENFQRTGSFKMRGAASKMTALDGGQKLITASSGNHGIASSRAASLTDQHLTVVLPETVAKVKLDKIRSYNVETILHGSESGKAETYAQSLAATGEYVYVSPYNDADVIAGQGTIGLELLEQAPRIDNVFISMGGGGLISGIGAVLKSFGSGTRIIGVAAENSAALAASMAVGSVVETQHFDTLADGIAGGMDADSLTFPISMEVVDQVILCSEADISNALRDLAQEENMLVEGAAALALAGFKQMSSQCADQTSVVLLCGANFDWETINPHVFG